MADFTEAYREAVASVPTDVIHYHTIEIKNSNFYDEDENVSIFLVKDNQELEAYIEDEHPLYGGQKVKFIPMAFDIVEASKEPAVVPQMVLTIDNVASYLDKYLELATSEEQPTQIIYRKYINKDLTGPAISPLELEVVSCSSDLSNVSIVCQMNNLTIKAVPNVEYTSLNFPNLVN